jgi:hypothetical protein
VGAATAGYARFGLDIPIITADAHAYHVNVPLSGSTESRCGDQEPVNSTPQRAEVFMPDRPADIRWSGDCGRFWLMIPRHTVQVEPERLLGRPATRPVEFATRMDLTSSLGRGWLDTMELIDKESRRPGGLLSHPLAAANLERLLVDGLLLG